MENIVSWCGIALTLLMTVYAQVIFKMRLTVAGPIPLSWRGFFSYVVILSTDPWIMSGIAAVAIAAFAWLLALSRLPLGVAYPFMSLTIVAVSLASALLLNEPIDSFYIVGLALICLGLVLIAYRLN